MYVFDPLIENTEKKERVYDIDQELLEWAFVICNYNSVFGLSLFEALFWKVANSSWRGKL